MDGAPNPKNKKYNGVLYSETRYAVIKWLEKELPNLAGSVINIGAGNWKLPKKLLTSKVTKYKTFDKEKYGSSKNNVDIYGDVQNMPSEWTKKWDNILCIEVIECVPNPFKAMDEMYRILKPQGTLILTCPFNYRWFGVGSWENPKQGAKDYFRITEDGWKLLTQQFSKVVIENSGPNVYDPYCYMIKAIK